MWSRVRLWLGALIVVWCSGTIYIGVYVLLPTNKKSDKSFDNPTISRTLLDDYDAAFEPCSRESLCTNFNRYGDARFAYGTSRGYYPAGCQWREVLGLDTPGNAYEYWDAAVREWTDEQPRACLLQTEEVPDGHVWNKATTPGVLDPTPATAVEPQGTHTILKNLWYNNGRWYALVEGSGHVEDIKISRNQYVRALHVRNATAWAANVRHRVVRRDTLLFDFIFFLHPTAIGHWCEMMFPLFSILKASRFHAPDVNVVLLHLQRRHLMEWVRAVMATTFAVPPGGSLPPILLQQEVSDPALQPHQPLDGVPTGTWVVFETAMVVRDLFTGGKRTFASRADARSFRERLYAAHGLTVPRPMPGFQPPQRITFQRKRANRRIVNEGAVLRLLQEFAPVDVVEFNASHSFRHQLETISRTGVFVSVHTSNLANAVFLPPHSAAVELIQRFWYWKNLDQSFVEQTAMLGDVHHFAWRAFHANQTVYLNSRDRERFGDWGFDQCRIEECVEAHTNVDVVVDIGQLRSLLALRIPAVLSGAQVRALRTPWPGIDPSRVQPWDVQPRGLRATGADV